MKPAQPKLTQFVAVCFWWRCRPPSRWCSPCSTCRPRCRPATVLWTGQAAVWSDDLTSPITPLNLSLFQTIIWCIKRSFLGLTTNWTIITSEWKASYYTSAAKSFRSRCTHSLMIWFQPSIKCPFRNSASSLLNKQIRLKLSNNMVEQYLYLPLLKHYISVIRTPNIK